ncbi:hypothetical protein K8U54_13005 [Pseudomonas fulva]|uniref:hypothetical protein n=1 Tax=Pseudomonas fulva TaxID=47880 RepID=UPI00201D72E1|nr:hypothetical protein [Pseudomonas fulva]UQY32662.1 hypothetical protein K8U54_13005 [Pseudomonas fulva]
MDTSVIRAWPRHIHELGQCARGARAIAENLNLDYSRFVLEGMPVDELRATGNAFAIALAEHAEKEAANGHG